MERREYDQNWREWKPGDRITWEDANKLGETYPITRIDSNGYIYWDDPAGGPENWTPWYNLVRVIHKE